MSLPSKDFLKNVALLYNNYLTVIEYSIIIEIRTASKTEKGTTMTRTLMLKSAAFDRIDDSEILGLYGDNGGDPDGNAWLPSMPVDEAEGEEFIKAGTGEMVNALFLTDEEIAETLSINDVLALAQEADDWDALQNAVADRVSGWAHYGAYGAMDSRWIILWQGR